MLHDSDGGTSRSGRTGRIGALVEHATGILVVVEDAAHATGFTAVLQEEVFIAPGLEHCVVSRIHAVAGALEGAVEMLRVLQEGVVRGEVGAAAEPPHRPGFEVAVVEVHRGDIGIAGVQHHRGAGGEPALALRLGPLAEDRRRQTVPLHLGEVHAALLEDPAGLHHPRATAATLWPHPALLLEPAFTIKSRQ